MNFIFKKAKISNVMFIQIAMFSQSLYYCATLC